MEVKEEEVVQDSLQMDTNQVNAKAGNDNDEEIKCKFCDFLTASPSNLTTHTKTAHNKKIKNFHCAKCNYSSSKSYNLSVHVQAVHDLVKNFECDRCDYSAARKKNLEGHVKNAHGGFRCDRCDYSAPKSRLLKLHLEVAHEKMHCDDDDDSGRVNYGDNTQERDNETASRISIEEFNQRANNDCNKSNIHSAAVNNFKCSKCNYTTTYKHSMKRHVSGVHENFRNFKCQICDYAAKHKLVLKRHVMAVHDMIRNFKCDLCEYAAVKKTSLKLHVIARHGTVINFTPDGRHLSTARRQSSKYNYVSAHEDGRPDDKNRIYSAAERKIYSKDSIKVREEKAALKMPDEVSQPEKNFKCSKCDYAIDNRHSLRWHVSSVHDGLRNFKCHLCDYGTTQKHTLTRHVMTVHNVIKTFKCNQCEYAAAQKTSLELHVMSSHGTLQNLTSNVCNLSTARSQPLYYHSESVYESRRKAESRSSTATSDTGGFKCDQCDYSTLKSCLLKLHFEVVHERTHRGNSVDKVSLGEATDKEAALKIDIEEFNLKANNGSNKSNIHSAEAHIFKCSKCDYATTVKRTMKRHVSGVHDKLRNFKCHLCDYAATQKTALKQHVLAVHDMVRNFKCHFCDYAATQKRTLKVHIMALHDMIKNFKCAQCEYTSAVKINLVLHLTYHHTNLTCDKCDYSTTEEKMLKHHYKAVHKNGRRRVEPNLYSLTSNTDMGRHGKSLADESVVGLSSLSIDDSASQKIRGHDQREGSTFLSDPTCSPAARNIVTETRQNTHRCKKCDYSTNKKSNLDTHVRAVHDNLRVFKCSHCQYSAAQKTHLLRHTRSKHERVEEYQCNKCNYSASQKTHLEAHLKSRHPPAGRDEEESEKALLSNSTEKTENVNMQCSKCDFQGVDLNSHVSEMHGQTKNMNIMDLGSSHTKVCYAIKSPDFECGKCHFKMVLSDTDGKDQINFCPKCGYPTNQVRETEDQEYTAMPSPLAGLENQKQNDERDVSNFCCELCPAKFLGLAALEKHFESAHHETVLKNEPSPDLQVKEEVTEFVPYF